MPTSQRRVTFGQDVVDDLRKMLREAPDAPDDKHAGYSKLELVRDLAPELRALTKRGWSWKAIAAMLSKRVAISPDLLQSYLRRSARPERKGGTEATSRAGGKKGRGVGTSGRGANMSRTPASPPPPNRPNDVKAEELLADDEWFSDDEVSGSVSGS
jgi:hypothetical protein